MCIKYDLTQQWGEFLILGTARVNVKIITLNGRAQQECVPCGCVCMKVWEMQHSP